jgi:hypothetical protein
MSPLGGFSDAVITSILNYDRIRRRLHSGGLGRGRMPMEKVVALDIHSQLKPVIQGL